MYSILFILSSPTASLHQSIVTFRLAVATPHEDDFFLRKKSSFSEFCCVPEEKFLRRNGYAFDVTRSLFRRARLFGGEVPDGHCMSPCMSEFFMRTCREQVGHRIFFPRTHRCAFVMFAHATGQKPDAIYGPKRIFNNYSLGSQRSTNIKYTDWLKIQSN